MIKERRREYDLIRAVSTVAIVLFHYSYSFVQYGVGGDHVYFMMHANGTWGAVFVSLFFMLSGASLYYNWKGRLKTVRGKGGVLDFYKKRWLSLFPMFYIGWFFFYMVNVISYDFLWNWGGSKRKLLLTLFGMDGYFLYREINYYTIGEWFLGAIIILYLLYPLLQFAMERIPVISIVFIVLLFGINTGRRLIPALSSYNEHIIISDNINIITCLLSFQAGMWLAVIGRRIIKAWPAFLILLAGLTIVPLPVSTLIVTPVMAVCFFALLTRIALWIDGAGEGGKAEDKEDDKVDGEDSNKLQSSLWDSIKKKGLTVYDGIIGFFSKYSYPVFLVHHVLVQKGMSFFTGKEFNYPMSILFFLVLLAVISLAAFLLSKFTDLVTKSMAVCITSVKGRVGSSKG